MFFPSNCSGRWYPRISRQARLQNVQLPCRSRQYTPCSAGSRNLRSSSSIPPRSFVLLPSAPVSVDTPLSILVSTLLLALAHARSCSASILNLLVVKQGHQHKRHPFRAPSRKSGC